MIRRYTSALSLFVWLHQCIQSTAFAPVTQLASSLRFTHRRLRLGSQTILKEDGLITIQEDEIEQADAVICGGGPAGLLSAIMLAQKFPDRKVRLFDRLSEPPNADDETVWNDVAKFYLIGLGGRGQTALKEFGVWEEVEKRCVAVVGRKDWPPDSKEGVERIFSKKDKLVTTVVLPRDKLVGVLHQHILENYKGRIELNYGFELHPLNFEYNSGGAVLAEVVKCSEEIARLNPSSVKVSSETQPEVMCDVGTAAYISTELLIAADGTVRTVANAMEREDKKRFDAMNPIQRLIAGKPFRVKRYVDDNQRIYKTVPFKIPSDWRGDLNYSARTKEGRINFDALPANENGVYCGVLLLKKGDPLAKENTEARELRELMDNALPQFSALLNDQDIETIAKKPVSYLPGFRYAGPRLHQGDHCVILGDCAHTVKPYFGLGANSALEDVKIFGDILDSKNKDIPKTVREFSRKCAEEAKALVRMSRDLDRPGKLGLLTFIFPLILDSIFHGMAPKIFRPNIITMLQREQYRFQDVARIKRQDRIAQLAIIAAGITGAGWTTKFVIQSVARMVGMRSSTITAGIIATAIGASLLRRFSSIMNPRNAPADVIVKLLEKVTDSKTHLTPLRKLNRESDATNGESFLTPLGFRNRDSNE